MSAPTVAAPVWAAAATGDPGDRLWCRMCDEQPADAGAGDGLCVVCRQDIAEDRINDPVPGVVVDRAPAVAGTPAPVVGEMVEAPQDASVVFSRLFAAYHGRVRRFLWSLVRDWDVADELTQVTFAGMWQRMASGRTVVTQPQDAFSLLAAAARWAEVTHYRDRTRSREHLLRDVDVPLDQVPGAARARAGAGIDDLVEARIRVAELLAVLPADQVQVLALHLVADLTLAQVADRTGWGVRQVERKRAEGLRRLRVVLGVPDAPAQTDARRREQILQTYLASVRAGRPLSLRALANRFGVSRATVSRILSPVRAPEPPVQPGARQAVRAGLREQIRSGAWPAGAPLPPAEALAPGWGTSPRTVLYALHDLAGEGLLTRDPDRTGGFRVTAPPGHGVGAVPEPRCEHCA